MISKLLLKNYAELLAEKGVNVQKGQFVKIVCDIDQPEFVYMVAKELYKRGAKSVI
ncbi:MAG: aminopeptidase, partial [Clostridia bacterium]|nr:aminopeptidase [Clostridia bacterium]